MSILVSQTVDPEDIIKQYHWLCESLEGHKDHNKFLDENEMPRYKIDLEPTIGLLNLLESIMFRLWGDTLIYQNEDGVYLVIMPDGTTTYLMQCNEHNTFFACIEWHEGDLTWTALDNGDMVPVGYMKEVSIISVEPVIREKVLKYISEDQGYYDQYLEPTT